MLWGALALAGPGTFDRGASEVQAGSALFQTGGHSRGFRDFGSVNVNGEYRRQITHGFFAGIQGAVHYLTYDQRRVSTLTGRFEPKVGLRVRLTPSTRLDTTLGVAVDFGSGGIRPGPVLALGLRQFLGRSSVFVSLEPRLAPIAWGSTTLMGCTSYCNQTQNYNPGGTGVLIAIGSSFRSVPVSAIE